VLASYWWFSFARIVTLTSGTPPNSEQLTGHSPENMATFRNLAISTLRAAGYRYIPDGLRDVSYCPFAHPLELLNIP
jgi:hypothetical protein